MVKDAARNDVPDARFVVSHLHREEKGSDVNVATHLLADVLQQRVDAIVVVSNDSDLKLPISLAREHVPVGLVTPAGRLAGDLAFDRDGGVGSHWQALLDERAFRAHQLRMASSGHSRPSSARNHGNPRESAVIRASTSRRSAT
jgi:uncharacterized LabA/DUF88 family protein